MITKRHVGYPSIEQFRTIVSNINRHFNFIGLDEKGEPIYDLTLPKPKLTFTGTVKLHGTNSGVCFNTIDGLWAQSRENIITPEKDNAGFSFFVESNKEEFYGLIDLIVDKTHVDTVLNTISIYGEWCGGSIQKGVGICNLSKSFFIFGVKITPHVETDEERKIKPAYWVDYTYLRNPNNGIYNISDYKTYSLEIDFNEPHLIQNKLAELTLEVEKECPVAKSFGFSGIGEGIVWSCEFKGVVYRFKIKGQQHSISKVKTIASVDVEKINSIKEFVDYAVTENRFNQAIGIIFPNNEEPDIKKMGDLIRWVVNDILKEEIDTMVSNKIEPKEVNKYISDRVRNMFFKLQV